jgi:hypothetical protein
MPAGCSFSGKEASSLAFMWFLKQMVWKAMVGGIRTSQFTHTETQSPCSLFLRSDHSQRPSCISLCVQQIHISVLRNTIKIFQPTGACPGTFVGKRRSALFREIGNHSLFSLSQPGRRMCTHVLDGFGA